jgi:hypothetical protein
MTVVVTVQLKAVSKGEMRVFLLVGSKGLSEVDETVETMGTSQVVEKAKIEAEYLVDS